MKLLILLLIASCSSYFPPIRGQYTLTSEKHFMYSNMYVNPSNLEQSENHLLIQYDVVAKNIDTKAHAVNLTKSKITLANRSFPMNCHRFREHDVEFSLDASAQTRIVCLGKIEKRDFAKSDYQTIIEIPLDQDMAKFEYLLRAEDFK